MSKLFAAYNVLAMFLLVPWLGIYGAAIAAGTAQTAKNLFVWWYVRHRAIWTNARAAVLSSVGIWGAVVGLCYAIKALVACACVGSGRAGSGHLHSRGPALHSQPGAVQVGPGDPEDRDAGQGHRDHAAGRVSCRPVEQEAGGPGCHFRESSRPLASNRDEALRCARHEIQHSCDCCCCSVSVSQTRLPTNHGTMPGGRARCWPPRRAP